MTCSRCRADLPEGARFCHICGAKLNLTQRSKNRGNGQGSVYQLKNKTWCAVKTVGYWTDDSGKAHRSTRSKYGFRTKKEALDALSTIEDRRAKKIPTLKELYDLWEPTHRAGRDTMNCYKAAFAYFRVLWNIKINNIDIDDLQECMDDCPKGKRTRQNMKAVCGLVYKYAVPRGLAQLNLGQYLIVGDGEDSSKEGLPPEELDKLWSIASSHTGAAYAVCQCYLGFRPSELLALDVERYSAQERAFVGGAKTEAGRNRTVTVSPKIQPLVDRIINGRTSGPVFCANDGSRLSLEIYRTMFYAALKAAGIDNPISERNGIKYHRYTPHSCRHTFATLMKGVPAPTADKLKLIGHTTDAQLRYYQDVDIENLRAITDQI